MAVCIGVGLSWLLIAGDGHCFFWLWKSARRVRAAKCIFAAQFCYCLRSYLDFFCRFLFLVVFVSLLVSTSFCV